MTVERRCYDTDVAPVPTGLKLTYHVAGVLPVCFLGAPYGPAQQNSAAQKQNGAIPKQKRNPTIRISNSRQGVQ